MPASLSLDCNQVGISIHAGQDVAISLTFLNSDGTPVDLTGANLKMQIAFPSPLLLTTASGGLPLTDPVNGIAQLNIPTSVTVDLPAGVYPFDFWEVTGINADFDFSGMFTVIPSITAVP